MARSVLLFTDDIEGAKDEIDAAGGRVTQQFTDRVFAADLPDRVDPEALERSTTEPPDTLDDVSRLAAAAWESLQDKLQSDAPAPDEGVRWDADDRLPPDRPEDLNHDGGSAASDIEPQLSTGTPTSLYMTGSVAVGVVIVAGTQDDLRFTAAEQQAVVQEVQEALDFLASAEPRATLSFDYDIRLITVSAAPGPTTSYERAEGPWRNAATATMGFSANRQGSLDYVHDLRQRKGTNWAYVAYFTKYPVHHFAYAVAEKIVMHYDNDGWGTNAINRVFAHETCHIFGAADEYGGCSCGGSHGFLGVANNNCRNCPGTEVSCLMDRNVLELCEWSRGQLGWDARLFPGDFAPLSTGRYVIQQKSSGRYMDAHESAAEDFGVTTGPAEGNVTEHWRLTPVGTLYTIQQVSTGRFLDAYTTEADDFSAVTRPAQADDSQRWVLVASPNEPATSTVQQLVNGRYLDAWESSTHDFEAVTRKRQNNDTQRWIVTARGNDVFTLQQRVNGRFLDAYESSNDFRAVTRAEENNESQQWLLTPIGGVYTVQQQSSGRFLDAYESSNDFRAVTRSAEVDDSQRWVVQAIGDDSFAIQHLANGRFLDAYESSGNDFAVVTRRRQNNDSQRWLIVPPPAS
jgi:hypothetical protein